MEELERRVEELEIRLSFQDDLIKQLDGVVRAQADRVDELVAQLEELRAQMETDGAGAFNPAAEVPPHY